jgi:hypothetical protein
VAELAAPQTIVPKANALGLDDPTTRYFVTAPAAAASEPPPNHTLDTQRETQQEAKPSLGASR